MSILVSRDTKYCPEMIPILNRVSATIYIKANTSKIKKVKARL